MAQSACIGGRGKSLPLASGKTSDDTAQGGERSRPSHRTRRRESLVQLSNAIQCYVLLAESERRLAPRTVRLYSEALSRLLDYAEQHHRTRLEDFTPNLVRAAAAAQMESGEAPNWRGGEAVAITVIVAARAMVRRLHLEYPDLSLPGLSVVKG